MKRINTIYKVKEKKVPTNLVGKADHSIDPDCVLVRHPTIEDPGRSPTSFEIRDPRSERVNNQYASMVSREKGWKRV